MNTGNTNNLSIGSNTQIIIQPDKMDTLVQDVNKAVMRLNDSFNRINNIVSGTSNYYKGESGDNIRRKFDEFYPNLTNIVQSIENYAYSLKNAKDNFLSQKQLTVSKIENATINVATKIPNNLE